MDSGSTAIQDRVRSWDDDPTLDEGAGGDVSEPGLGWLGRLPHGVLTRLTGRFVWETVIQLSCCSTQLHRQHGVWVRHRMRHASSAMGVIDALLGISTLSKAQHPALLREFSAQMVTTSGAGAETVLAMWQRCFAQSKAWLALQPDAVQCDGAIDLLIAGYRAVAPKDPVKPGWVARDSLLYMSSLPMTHWPDVLSALFEARAYAEDLAFYIEEFARNFEGPLPRVSDPFAIALAKTLLFSLREKHVSGTLARQFGVQAEQQARIADDIAQAIGAAAAQTAVTRQGALLLDVCCKRWHYENGALGQRMAERHFIAAIGAPIRLDHSWETLLLRGGALSSPARALAHEHIVLIERDTLLALNGDCEAQQAFLAQREAIGGVMNGKQWQQACEDLSDLPWQAQPALMHRLASRVSPLQRWLWFDDERGMAILSEVSNWTTAIVPCCLEHGKDRLAARAMSATLSLWSTLADIDPLTSGDVVREVLESGLVLLPPAEWGILFDTLCFSARPGKAMEVHPVEARILEKAMRLFLCDPTSRFLSPSPIFAKWICREVPACWESLPDGPAPHRRWKAFCDRFDLPPAMRQYLRRRVLAHYASELETVVEPVAAVLLRAGFTDTQSLQDIEDALWRNQLKRSGSMRLRKRLEVFGLTPRLREKIEDQRRHELGMLRIMETVTQ